MSRHIIETVFFNLAPGVQPAEFHKAAEESNAWVCAQPGFVRRRLSQTEDGAWIDHVEWTSLDGAKAAAQAIGTAPAIRPFIAAIDGASVRMTHSVVQVSAG